MKNVLSVYIMKQRIIRELDLFEEEWRETPTYFFFLLFFSFSEYSLCKFIGTLHLYCICALLNIYLFTFISAIVYVYSVQYVQKTYMKRNLFSLTNLTRATLKKTQRFALIHEALASVKFRCVQTYAVLFTLLAYHPLFSREHFIIRSRLGVVGEFQDYYRFCVKPACSALGSSECYAQVV